MQDYMAELKTMPIWFHWHWEQDKNGRKTKVPRAASGGATGTSEKWSHTWVTYGEALALKDECRASGLGFKVPEGYFFLDADHYDLEYSFIKMLLSRFDSYAERSVSGGGIHIYGKCDSTQLPYITTRSGKKKLSSDYYTKNPSNRLELYSTAIDAEFEELTFELEIIVGLTRKCIEENSTLAQDQNEYTTRYNGYVERYESTQARIQELEKKKAERKEKYDAFESFITAFASQEKSLTEFDEGMWCLLLDMVTMYASGELEFWFKDGSAIKK